MSNIWNAEKLVVGTLVSDNIRNSSGEKYSTPESSNTKHQVGEQWISMDGTVPFGGVPFLGQTVTTEVYKELYNWATKNNRIISEEEWQSLYSSQNGNVPYYAHGTDGRSGRTAWVELQEGNYLDATAISGMFGIYFNYYNKNENEETYDDETFQFISPLPTDGIITESFLQSVADSFNSLENVPITFSFKTLKSDDTIIAYGFYAEFKDFGAPRQFNHVGILEGTDENNYSVYAAEDFNEEEHETPPTQFRMPLFKGYLKANVIAGNYEAEGLPNITGSISLGEGLARITSITNSGALIGTTYTSTYTGFNTTDEAYKMKKIEMNASLSNSIYGNSDHVTPETNTVLIGVYAFNEISNPAVVNAEEYRQAIVNNEIVVNDCVVKVDSYTGKIDTNENNILKNCPVGCIMMYAKSATPTGWLTCNGASINRETYKDLFNVIGTTFGAGDGSTTFALPNLTNKFAMGNDTVGTAKAAGLPNITGTFYTNWFYTGSGTAPSGAFSLNNATSNAVEAWASQKAAKQRFDFNASRSSSIYGAATTVQPPALTLRFIIKY